MWGWTAPALPAERCMDVFPTHVGVDRTRRRRSTPGSGYSPRMWGWTYLFNMRLVSNYVFPTHVGVDRRRAAPAVSGQRIPHACGGGPLDGLTPRVLSLRIPHACGGGPRRCESCSSGAAYSPRMWGWTVEPDQERPRDRVFPTHVGVDRPTPAILTKTGMYSPRMWGWTALRLADGRDPGVFPTHVGVDR